MSKNACDKAIEILHGTNDGENLSPEHLSLLQEMVNGHLNELGEQEFEKLYQAVQEGYTKPWFHDIENLTINHKGNVFWKGKSVEHYNLPWGWSEGGKDSAQELADRCLHLESIGVEPSSITAVWSWEKYAPAVK